MALPVYRDCNPAHYVPVTTSPGTALLLAMCERRNVPLAVADKHGGVRILRTSAGLHNHYGRNRP